MMAVFFFMANENGFKIHAHIHILVTLSGLKVYNDLYVNESY